MSISECGKEGTLDMNHLSLNIQFILSRLKSMQKKQETSKKSLQKAYREHERNVIEEMRQMINSEFVDKEYEH
ncbi:hypothetical protein DPMN_000332 [Dreissena polymorpha]|uniref:Uncharacterized protein n=1 Tax=Dreissena polymorpha TaxID=45954 RepID=A0A9D4MH58_DREPO|nr:hypothetical protein DPMN_000332 [Dreissena polymorpha]